MILNIFYAVQSFQHRKTETPAQGWRRAGDTLPGGAERETPALGWRRAGDALTGGVNGSKYRGAASRCQGLDPRGTGL